LILQSEVKSATKNGCNFFQRHRVVAKKLRIFFSLPTLILRYRIQIFAHHKILQRQYPCRLQPHLILPSEVKSAAKNGRVFFSKTSSGGKKNAKIFPRAYSINLDKIDL
jgi:hypothetical protein